MSIRENLHDIEFGNNYLVMRPKAQATKAKNHSIKIKNYHAPKVTVNRMSGVTHRM
jgi:hypothetical protein